MDQLDADILRRTQFPSSLMEERPTYYSIAKSMKQNPSTVRNRISKMKESGVLKDIVAIPDPGILNMKRIAVLLSCDYKTSEAIIREMGKFRSLMGIHRAVHSTIGLIMEFMYREEEELESDLTALKEISETVQIMMKVLCELVGRTLYDTRRIDGDVGGELKMALIRPEGFDWVPDE